jgi:hypothetical protein
MIAFVPVPSALRNASRPKGWTDFCATRRGPPVLLRGVAVFNKSQAEEIRRLKAVQKHAG